jgi:hypothetical protein
LTSKRKRATLLNINFLFIYYSAGHVSIPTTSSFHYTSITWTTFSWTNGNDLFWFLFHKWKVSVLLLCLLKPQVLTLALFIIRFQTKEARRAEHNAIERARRESLNTKFQQLAHSLPNLQNDRRPSKGTIIERTLEFGKKRLHRTAQGKIMSLTTLLYWL